VQDCETICVLKELLGWRLQDGTMQDRYAGDVGDFVKLGLLRALSFDKKLGVAWYRFPNEDHNKDGRHISYLDQPDLYASLDSDLFIHLKNVARTGRLIAHLVPTLGEAIFSDESLDVSKTHARVRRSWRKKWFSRTLSQLADCDLVFADPDNGIVDDNDWRKGSSKFGKQIPVEEVRALANGRCAIIYHHNTRRQGGHDAEVNYWLKEIGLPALAVRAKARSPRTFFVFNPGPEIVARVRQFCEKWANLSVFLHRSE
jgi:hypothetical protein